MTQAGADPDRRALALVLCQLLATFPVAAPEQTGPQILKLPILNWRKAARPFVAPWHIPIMLQAHNNPLNNTFWG